MSRTFTTMVVGMLVGLLGLAIGHAQGAVFYETDFERNETGQAGAFDPGPMTGQGDPAWANNFSGGGCCQSENSGNVVNAEHFSGAQSLHLFSNGTTEGETSRVAFTAGGQPLWMEFAFRIENAITSPFNRISTFRHLAGNGEPGSAVGVFLKFTADGNRILANDTPVGNFVEQQWHTISLKMDGAGSGYSGSYDVFLDGALAGTGTFNAGSSDFLRGMVFAARIDENSPGNDWFIDSVILHDGPDLLLPEPTTALVLVSAGGLLVLRRRNG